MRWSFVGSIGWFGSVYSPRLPSPLVSRMSAVQPCDFSSSPVSSNIFVSSQPTTAPPPLVHSVRFASSANIKWCVPKHVLMCVSFFVFGSYIASCRPERFTGKSLADGCVDPALQNAGLSGGRMLDVIQTRPFSSIIGLWTLFLLAQRMVSPQYADGAPVGGPVAGCVFGSRTVSGTRLTLLWTGS